MLENLHFIMQTTAGAFKMFYVNKGCKRGYIWTQQEGDTKMHFALWWYKCKMCKNSMQKIHNRNMF